MHNDTDVGNEESRPTTAGKEEGDRGKGKALRIRVTEVFTCRGVRVKGGSEGMEEDSYRSFAKEKDGKQTALY